MKHDPLPPPCAERLAAYYEGTLDAAQRQIVEDWLVEHPEVAAEFIALQQMQHLFQSAAAPELSESAWAAVRERVDQELCRPRSTARSRRWLGWSAAAVAGIALGLMVRSRPVPVAPQEVAEVFPVAVAEDVEITSVDAAGARALLVGTPPVREPIVLMVAGDASLKRVAIERDGQFPEVRMAPGEQTAPMIVAPVAAGSILDAP